MASASCGQPTVFALDGADCKTGGEWATVFGKGEKEKKEEDDYALIPHTGHLVLDKPFDQEGMYVVHRLSMERAALPTGGDWFL